MDALTTARTAGLYRTIKELADQTSPDLTLRQLMVLLYVGSKGFPVAQGEVVQRLEIGKGTASKIVSVLGGITGGIKRSDGLGLLSVEFDPSDYRTRMLELSKDGERLLKRVIAVLQKAFEGTP